MAADPAVLRVVTAYGDRATAVRQQVLAYINRVWGSLDAWRAADIERFVAAVVPVVTGGQVQIAALTDAYLAAVEAAITGRTVRPVGVPTSVVSDETIRGVTTADVYRRTGPTVWGALSEGATLDAAVGKGLQRALSMAATDMQLAKTHTARHVLSDKANVVGHRRTLTGSRSCGLCIVAATQRYRKADLQPIHPGCDCGVVPIIAGRDPGQVIEPQDLEQVHQAISDRFGAFDSGARSIPGVSKPSGDPVQYRDVLVTHRHGELGPVLGVRGQKFTGPSDI